MDLAEDGNYNIRIEKRARFLGLFQLREEVKMQIDAETGEVVSQRAPWWSFLSADVEVEED